MKIATIAALIGSASAFAPAQTGKVRLTIQFFFVIFFVQLFVCVWWMDKICDERDKNSGEDLLERQSIIQMHYTTMFLRIGWQSIIQ